MILSFGAKKKALPVIKTIAVFKNFFYTLHKTQVQTSLISVSSIVGWDRRRGKGKKTPIKTAIVLQLETAIAVLRLKLNSADGILLQYI